MLTKHNRGSIHIYVHKLIVECITHLFIKKNGVRNLIKSRWNLVIFSFTIYGNINNRDCDYEVTSVQEYYLLIITVVGVCNND